MEAWSHPFFLLLPFSLSLPFFFRLIPWNTEALCIRFPAWTSKTQWRRRSVSSLQLEGACGLPEQSKSLVCGFIGFLCKPRNISFYSFLSHSFTHSFTNAVTLWIPWSQPGQGPGRKEWTRSWLVDANNKVLMHSTENYIQYPMINHNGKEHKKKKVYMYIMCHFAIQQRLA